jgi:hypothetical protein
MFIRPIDKTRNKSYMGTIRPMQADDDVFLKGVRRFVGGLNAGLKDTGASYKFRVSLTPSKPHKRFAWKYNNNHSPRKIRIEDAETVDVYVHKTKV